ncbi:hypothetical protein CANCADRAFT_22281 [Tortispora caseinolytica NRRL Y-17796]|uniref:Major facilitator superfamily (MFS) profile domain-containing protein n=1 Tax=Tortispora caseinolytica NRRL Y-17796 TaxID=767744 RepID=A0A1E4TIE6_9ASCO|nr:hypothetical protein CANCADRAFT_22281 [Tortispora caseinolytica NRRL Y-17796]
MEAEHLTFRALLVILVACMGSLQYGYHLAELNAPGSVMPCTSGSSVNCLQMSPQGYGFVTSVFNAGGLIGALIAARISGKFGRRHASFLASLMFLVGSSVMAAAQSVAVLALGRILAGLGAGIAIVNTPIYIAEIAPVAHKGILGTMNQVFINIGILLAQVLGVFWATTVLWRRILWTGAAVATLNAAFVLLLAIESPRWFVLRGRIADAKKAFNAIHSGNARNTEFRDSLLEAQPTVPSSSATSLVSLKTFVTASIFRKPLIAVAGLNAVQQLSGINVIVFYGVTVLATIIPQNSAVINCVISTVNLLVTVIASPSVEKYGRKPLLLCSIAGMGICSATLGVAMINQRAIVSCVSSVLFVAFYAIGLGPIPFYLVSEITPHDAIGAAQSVGMSFNWTITFFVAYLFPLLEDLLSGYVFFVFTALGLISLIFVSLFIPETKGKKSPEEVWGTTLAD